MSVLKFLTVSSLALVFASCNNLNDKTEVPEAKQEAQLKKMQSKNPDIKLLSDLALSKGYGYEITKSLTTEIGARLAGTVAEEKARMWAIEKFKEIGIDNARVEPFTVDGWERGVETARIVLPSKQTLFVTALGGSVSTPSGGIEAPVVFFKTFEDLKNAPQTGLEGKIVYISGLMERTINGAGYGPANQKRRQGATESAKRGALAVLIRSVGTDSHRFPHTGQMSYSPDMKKIPIGAISGPDADQLDRIFSSGEDVTINMDLNTRSTGTKNSGNVIADIIGTEKPDEIILIGAHLDSWDLGTGAIDDGAGVGIVMGAAKALLDSGLKPKRTIRIVLFGAEEIGLKGGYAYVEAHKDTDLANHVMATESDFGAERIYSIQSGESNANIAGVKAIAPEFKFLGIEFQEGFSTGGPDIGPMSREGVPTLRLNQDGTDYFDLHHTPDDTFDKIDPKAMAQNVAAYATMVWLASEAETNFKD